MQKCTTETRKWHLEYFAVDVIDFTLLPYFLNMEAWTQEVFPLVVWSFHSTAR